jgi:hypothetical protein
VARRRHWRSAHFASPSAVGVLAVIPGLAPQLSANTTVRSIETLFGGRTRANPPRQPARFSAGHRLGKCESHQASAKQDKAGNGHCEEALGSEFITHHTPPIERPRSKELLFRRTVKRIRFQTGHFGRVMFSSNTISSGRTYAQAQRRSRMAFNTARKPRDKQS